MRRQCAKCPWRKSTDPHDIQAYVGWLAHQKQAIEHARERSEVEEERRAVKPKRSKKR